MVDVGDEKWNFARLDPLPAIASIGLSVLQVSANDFSWHPECQVGYHGALIRDKEIGRLLTVVTGHDHVQSCLFHHLSYRCPIDLLF